MREIIVECEGMQTPGEALQILSKTFGTPLGDLETLYEYLLSVEKPVEITFEDVDLLDVYLDEFGQEILDTFERAAGENENLELI